MGSMAGAISSTEKEGMQRIRTRSSGDALTLLMDKGTVKT